MGTTVEFSAPRRSTRIFRKMKMNAQGRAHNGRKFRETCETLVVSVHGGLLMLKHEVDNGELLVLEPADRLKARYDSATLEEAFFAASGHAFENGDGGDD